MVLRSLMASIHNSLEFFDGFVLFDGLTGLLDLSFDGLAGLLDLNSMILQVYVTSIRSMTSI